MTISEAVVDLKNLIGPAGKGSEVSDGDLIEWIIEAIYDVADEIIEVNPDFFIKTVTTAAIVNQVEYALPSDFANLVLLEINYGDGWVTCSKIQNLSQITYASDTTYNSYTQADPRYYLSGSNIGILPAPLATLADSIKIRYSYLPAEATLLGTSEIPLPIQLHRKLKYLARCNYMTQDDQHTSSAQMRERYMSDIRIKIDRLCSRNSDQPESVVVTGGYDLYSGEVTAI